MIAHRPALAIALVLAPAMALFVASPSRAATRSGSLGAAASASVLIAVDCADSGSGVPASLTIQIANLAPISGALVSAQIRKGNLATNTTDALDDDGNASPAVFVNGGTGRYDVFVDKTAAGAEAFLLTAQCWTGAGGTGVPAGTSIAAAEGGNVPTGSGWGAILLGLALVVAGLSPLRARASRAAR
ncbi:MAG: hypothetical protein IPK00_20150 [Deltaproteobacteria bacterium]|nr:hypothetical protein [Deltaproteobacteria bacterium]